MKPPPLPDNFGNYALGDFIEVVAPAEVSWWPQTAGWVWLGGFLAAYLLYSGWRALKRWHRNRYRREARRRLAQLSLAPADAARVTAASEILKITALAAYPRARVASLSGRDWTAFLNSRCEGEIFDAELSGLLAEAQYREASPSASQHAALLQACRHWVTQHRTPTDV